MGLVDIKKQIPAKILGLGSYTIHFIDFKAKKAPETNFSAKINFTSF